MANTMNTLVARIRTVLRAVDGTNSYTYNLSSDVDQVDYGDAWARSPPAIRILEWGIENSEDATLTRYRRDIRVKILGYVGASTDNPGDRMLAAGDLANDIHLAIEADRVNTGAGTLGTLTTQTNVSSDVLDGNSIQIDGMGVVLAEVTMSYRTTTGV